jgi:pimeloyl-ACP methyl ester carboxylesterase
MNSGWRTNVPKIKSPTLIMLGEFDNFERRHDAWKALTAEHKVFVEVACGSHFLIYEKNRRVLHAASKEWLPHGTVAGQKQGYVNADRDGKIQ